MMKLKNSDYMTITSCESMRKHECFPLCSHFEEKAHAASNGSKTVSLPNAIQILALSK